MAPSETSSAWSEPTWSEVSAPAPPAKECDGDSSVSSFADVAGEVPATPPSEPPEEPSPPEPTMFEALVAQLRTQPAQVPVVQEGVPTADGQRVSPRDSDLLVAILQQATKAAQLLQELVDIKNEQG